MENATKKLLSEEDLELIERFKSGDKKAFNLIVLKYQNMVYATTRKMLINHDDADEVTQTVFIRLLKSLKDFRGESKLSTYLYRISVNLSLNYLKNKNKNKSRIVDNSDLENVPDKIDISKDIENFEGENLVRKIIDSLPPQQRAVFILRFYEDLSYEEISQILGVSVGGLKANYFHAIKNLKTYFEKQNFNIKNNSNV